VTVDARTLPVPGRWSVHSYYTVSPYAPDGSGRVLAAGADLADGTGEVVVLSNTGEVLDRFGRHRLQTSFFHTGWWQTWSPDAHHVYFQSGPPEAPTITRRELATGREVTVDGDMEGAPPGGVPIVSGLLGMLYAAGYGTRRYAPEQAPVPFQERDRHGLFSYTFDPPEQTLVASVAQILDAHPDRDRIAASDREVRGRLGDGEGLTLMAYCVRWSPDGSRLLFFFGNHRVVAERGEPRLSYVMTADRDLEEIRLALDLSYGRPGLHWSWQPDNEHLIGYGPDPHADGRLCLAEVRHDGSGYRKLSDHRSGGHVSVSPTDPDLVVTDEGTPEGGAVVFLSRASGAEIGRVALPKFRGPAEPPGRNPDRVCHHPVFRPDGRRVLCNTLPGRDAVLAELSVPGAP